MNGPTIETDRLTLRRWRAADREPFAALNADPEVMAFFVAPLTREGSDQLIDRLDSRFEEDGFGMWALEVRATGSFIGFTGIAVVRFEAPFTPAVEIGWRLARSAWGLGYATEAARASLDFGFGDGGLDEVVSFTTVGNARSRAVMERLGMTRDPADDFEHPGIRGHLLAPHVLYRVSKEEWLARRGVLSRRS